jgi:hypothetical protein
MDCSCSHVNELSDAQAIPHRSQATRRSSSEARISVARRPPRPGICRRSATPDTRRSAVVVCAMSTAWLAEARGEQHAPYRVVCPVADRSTECLTMDESGMGPSLLRGCHAVLEVATGMATVGRHTLSLLVPDRVDRRPAESAHRARNVLAGITRIAVAPATASAVSESSVLNARPSPFEPRPHALHGRRAEYDALAVAKQRNTSQSYGLTTP